MKGYEKALAPLLRRLNHAWLTPDILTLLTVPPSLLAGFFAAKGWFVVAAVFFLISGMLDLLDGALARTQGRTTRFGALLDSSVDRVADACIPIGLVVYYAPFGAVAAIPAVALLASLWISYIRARAQSLGLELPRLWMRRQDRFFAILAGLLLSRFFWTSAPVPDMLLLLVTGSIAILGMLAGAMALARAARLADQVPPPQ